MKRGALLRLLALLLACWPIASAWSDPAQLVPVRVGNHPGYGRVVFDLPTRLDYHVTQQGQHVVVEFAGNVTIASSAALPRNVLGITGGAGKAELTVAPDTVVRELRYADHVVIDVLDKGAASTSDVQGKPAQQIPPGQAPSAPPDHPAAPLPPAKPLADAPTGPPPGPREPAPPRAVITPGQPVAAAAQQQATPATPQPIAPPAPAAEAPPAQAPAPAAPATPPPDPGSPAADDTASPQLAANPAAPLVVPFEAPIGLAAFRRGNLALIVIDQRQPMDMTPWHDDPVFANATVQLLAAATVVSVALDPGVALALSRDAHAWRITAAPGRPKLQPIQPVARDGRVAFVAAAPGGVVSVIDPQTGTTLLVGTQRQIGQGVAVWRRAAEFTLLPTWQGIVIGPLADNLTLRPTQDGFVLTAGAGPLALSALPDPADLLAYAAGLTRRFDFPNLSAEASMRRLRRDVDTEAATPVLARGPLRRATAQTLLALGLGPEAQALAQMAATDDPHEAATPDNAALTAMAAVLAHRPDDAKGLNDRNLAATDDIALWRALRLAQLEEGSPQAAAEIAATMPLLFTYPTTLRDQLLPLATETLVRGGELSAASAVLAAAKDAPGLALARGMLKEAQGDTPAAQAIYDTLAQSADQSDHARAAVRAVELRLASGKIDAKQAADDLDKLLYAWRGDQRERALRKRVAELKARTGSWRQALGVLRDTEPLFPDDKAAIHAELIDMFTAMLRENAEDALAPLELVALVDENADLMPEGPAGEALEARLADKLLALDLPARAGPLLDKLMKSAPTAPGRATFGARLAELRQREGDWAGVQAALDASTGEALPAELLERRTLLLAAADARRGNSEKALAALAALGTAATDEARAGILERASDWPAAEKALTDYAAKSVPTQGKLDDAQRRTLLRLATAAARAGDDTTLATMRQRDSPRMEAGPLADMFRLLTAEPVRGVADLKRSGQEAALARQLPTELKAVQAPARPPP
jgi:hypothetical protein